MTDNPEMPEAVALSELKSHEGQTVCVQGWLYNRRSSKKLHFLQLRDGSGIVQAIVSKADVSEELFERAGAISFATADYSPRLSTSRL